MPEETVMIIDNYDSKGLGSLLLSYTGELYGIAFCRTHNHSDSEDIVQDVIVKLLQANEKMHFKSVEHLKHWLIRVTINRCNDYWRISIRHPLIPLDNIHDEAILYENEDESVDLTLLHPKERQILRLYYYEGFSTREISYKLDISESSVRKRLSRARQKLRTKIGTR